MKSMILLHNENWKNSLLVFSNQTVLKFRLHLNEAYDDNTEKLTGKLFHNWLRTFEFNTLYQMMNTHCTSDDLVEYEWTELFKSKLPWNTPGNKWLLNRHLCIQITTYVIYVILLLQSKLYSRKDNCALPTINRAGLHSIDCHNHTSD